MAIRRAQATWQGTLKEGQGVMKLSSGAYEGPFSFMSRFEEGAGTNPEELVAAAHAGCFSMALSSRLTNAGFTPTRISTTAEAHFEKLEEGWRIVRMHLITEAEVPGLEADAFQEHAEEAKKGCPVSNMFAGRIAITLEAALR